MMTCENNIWSYKDAEGKEPYRQQWEEATASYTWTDDVPKAVLMIKLNPDITPAKQEFITNGVRNLLSSTDVILQSKDVVESVEALNIVFAIFVAITAFIAIFIAFFLLLIAMTQNINDAIWEYGVLRSMGLTKAEG